jgi:signal peptidase I
MTFWDFFMEKRHAMAPKKTMMSQKDATGVAEASPKPAVPLLARIREWTDAIVLATLVAMLVRTFVVEPFKIPSGSMSPELLGDLVAQGTADGPDGRTNEFLIIMRDRRLPSQVQIYQRDPANGYWLYQGRREYAQLTFSQQQMVQQNRRIEEHRILVNRFAYWFSRPHRGDIPVFRVPFSREPSFFTVEGQTIPVRAFNRNQPVYVKRVVGLPGEEVTILGNARRLQINGKLLDSPSPFDHNVYTLPQGFVSWSMVMPDDGYALFGDNSDNSEDSRYWGPVSHSRLRGKSFLVYWPLHRAKFL